jgi:hypothetical protein
MVIGGDIRLLVSFSSSWVSSMGVIRTSSPMNSRGSVTWLPFPNSLTT